MSVLVGKQAPDFKATAVINNQFKEIKLSDYRGKYVVLFFYPLDFTFVCPTEITAFSDKIKEFESRNTVVLGCSVDSEHSHLAWINTSRKDGGLGGLTYPLIADLKKEIARAYDVLFDDSIALRGTFLIDKEGIVQHQVVNHLSLGRNIDEAIRMVDALQFTEEHGEVCPANWEKGEKGMAGSVEGVKNYYAGQV